MGPWGYAGIYAAGWIVTSLVMYYLVDRDGDRKSAIAWGAVWPGTWILGMILGELLLWAVILEVLDGICSLFVIIAQWIASLFKKVFHPKRD